MKKCTLILTVLIAITINSNAQNVFIPDTNFRAFLNANYPTFMDATGDSLIPAKAATLTGALDCPDQNIADLTGIECFINITRLYCYNNQLSTLPYLLANTALQVLYCFNNQLSGLDLSNNTALQELICYNNQLSALNLKNVILNDTSFNAHNNPDLYCIEVDDPAWALANWTAIDSWATFAHNCLYDIADPNIITGRVVIDDNCVMDGTEQGLKGIIVKTDPEYFYGITDSLGAYTISTDTGTYQVEQLVNHLLINPLCPIPNYHTVSFDTLAWTLLILIFIMKKLNVHT